MNGHLLFSYKTQCWSHSKGTVELNDTDEGNEVNNILCGTFIKSSVVTGIYVMVHDRVFLVYSERPHIIV